MAAPVTKASWTCASAADVARGHGAGRAHRAIRAAGPGASEPSHGRRSSPRSTTSRDARGVGVGAGAHRASSESDAAAILAALRAAKRPLILAGPASCTRAGRRRLALLESADRNSVRGHGEPARDQRSVPRRVRRNPGRGRLHPAPRQAPRFHAGVRPGARDRCEVRLPADRPRSASSSIAPGAQWRVAWARVAVADVAAAIDALDGARAANPDRPHEAWLDEVRAAIAYRPAAWDRVRATRAREAPSGRSVPAVAASSRQPSGFGLRLRRRRIRPMGAGVPSARRIASSMAWPGRSVPHCRSRSPPDSPSRRRR